MKKLIFTSLMLVSSMGLTTLTSAQNVATTTEGILPYDPSWSNWNLLGPVMRPQNASSSTMQNVTGIADFISNLYIHTWDCISQPDKAGIAWRMTDDNGNTVDEGFRHIKYADDVDAVIFKEQGAYFAIAAFYYDDGITKGHYYHLYKFTPSGLIQIANMEHLSDAPTFGRINVDATAYGVAITWCEPGHGIFVKVKELGNNFGPTMHLDNTDNMVDPDVCIRRGYGGSNSGLDLQIATLRDNRNVAFVMNIPFYDVYSGSNNSPTIEGTWIANLSNPYGYGTFLPPRIDCPDIWGYNQKWAVTLGEHSYTSNVNYLQNLRVVVKNDAWSSTPVVVPIAAPYLISNVTTGYNNPINPVIAYNKEGDQVIVGWNSNQASTSIPNSNNAKYFALNIKDAGGAPPQVMSNTFSQIRNGAGSATPVLAFSGQNLDSDNDGLYVAYSIDDPNIGYAMAYKSRKWPVYTFNNILEFSNSSLSVKPNPFNGELSFTATKEGKFEIEIYNMVGAKVYGSSTQFGKDQHVSIPTDNLASGSYVINIISKDANINHSEIVIKK